VKPFRASLLAVALCLAVTACDRRAGADKKQAAVKAKQSRLEWHRNSLVEAYRTNGFTGAAWDIPAEEALELLAETRAGENPQTAETRAALEQALKNAVSAGCDDPLIGYLHVRYIISATTSDPLVYARAMGSAAEKLHASDYNSLLKFFGFLRAAEASVVEIGPDNKIPPHVISYRFAAGTNLLDVLRDRTIPVADVLDTIEEWLPTARRSARQFAEDLKFMEPELANWGDAPVILLARAKLGVASAWNARGTGYADSVTPEKWKVFNERLNAVKGHLDRAWKADPSDSRIATAMLDVAVGLSFDRAEMEKWFALSMKLNSNNYAACEKKLHYLKPQWFGSDEEMVNFGRQCVSNSWGGSVPLTLLDAHRAIVAFLPQAQQLPYWKQPVVWRDIDTAFKRFFELNPEAIDYRHNYAWYAFHAGEMHLFKEQLSFFKGTNYSYFGGKQQFEAMVAKAQISVR